MKIGGLIDGWQQSWRWFSMQGLAFLSIAPIIYENASFLQDFIAPTYFRYGMGALGLLTLISRLVRQEPKDAPNP